MSIESQQDVRDVLTRTVRIESDMYTLKLSSQSQQNALTQLQGAVQQVLNILLQPPPPLPPAVPISPNRRSEGSVHLGSLSGLPPPSLVASIAPPSYNSSADVPVTSSQEAHELCPFAGCTATAHKCTALSSLRHMQTCSHCPVPFYRYLDIAIHMSSFQKHPRVTSSEVCCWCAENFDPAQSVDSRSRHRSACRDKAKLCLEVLCVVLVCCVLFSVFI
jgi:hypothetical protein